MITELLGGRNFEEEVEEGEGEGEEAGEGVEFAYVQTPWKFLQIPFVFKVYVQWHLVQS